MDIYVGREVLRPVVLAFYDRVRADALLGPLFERAVAHWPEHLDRLVLFWTSVMGSTGAYKGNPMAAHMRHADHITPAMFDRWLMLWAETTDAALPATVAAALQERAQRIARSLSLGLFVRATLEAGPVTVRTGGTAHWPQGTAGPPA